MSKQKIEESVESRGAGRLGAQGSLLEEEVTELLGRRKSERQLWTLRRAIAMDMGSRGI